MNLIERKSEIVDIALVSQFKQGIAAVTLCTKLPKHPKVKSFEESPCEDNFFISQKELDGRPITFEILEQVKKYFYVDPNKFESFKRLLARKSTTDKQYYEMCASFSKIDAIKTLEKENFDFNCLLWTNWNSGLVYQFDKELPFSHWEFISYISGVRNDEYDLTMAEEILKKLDYVEEVERINIPYYNSTKDCNQAVEFSVCLPQEQLDEICIELKKGKYPYWSTQIKESILGKSRYNFDPLGLRAALKKSSKKIQPSEESDAVSMY